MTHNSEPTDELTDLPITDKEQLVEAIVVALVTIAFFIYTFTFEEVPEILAQGIGPAIFPRGVLVVIFGLACILGYQALKPTFEARAKIKPYKRIQPIVFKTAGAMLLFGIGLHFIGTLPSILIFSLGLSFLWNERRYRAMALTFVLFTAAVYALFQLTLGVSLP